MTNKTLHDMTIELARESGINDATGTLYLVCAQAIRDGEGTTDDVCRIWDAAGEEHRAEHDAHD